MTNKRRDEYVSATQYRDVRLDLKRADDETRTIPASLSSQTPIRRDSWAGRFDEILIHEPDAIDLARAENGLPLLFGHDRDAVPLGVVRDVEIVGNRLEGTFHFGSNERARDIWPDVRDGLLNNVSIGYRIDGYEWTERSEDERAQGLVDELKVTSWRLDEASIVPVPADISVGVNRSEDTSMADEKTKPSAGTAEARSEETETSPVVQFGRTRVEGRLEGEQAERERSRQIRAVFKPYMARAEVADLCDWCVDEGKSLAESQRQLIALLGEGQMPVMRTEVQQSERTQPPSAGQRRERIEAGEDGGDKLTRGIELALNMRAGNFDSKTDADAIREAQSNGYAGMTLIELAREYVRTFNPDKAGASRQDIPGIAFQTRATIAHGTGSFGNLLENVARKSMLRGFNEAPEVWDRVGRIIEVPDFKVNSLLKVTNATGLQKVGESGEIEGVTMSDGKETIQLSTYAGRFDISRQALINDDMNALGTIPARLGQAASRNVGDVVFTQVVVELDALTLNEDGIAVLNTATHANYVGTSGAAPSTATLDAGRVAMATQTDPTSGRALNTRWTTANPAKLIVPVAIETASEVVVTTPAYPEIDFSGASANQMTPNPFQNRLEVVADARLDADSATRWYVMADPMLYDTLVIAFLTGQREPTVETMSPWDSLGASYRVYHDVACAPVDYRYIYGNVGA